MSKVSLHQRFLRALHFPQVSDNQLDYNSETETLSDECYLLGTELELEFTISGENPFIYFAYYNGQEVCNLLAVMIGESSE